MDPCGIPTGIDWVLELSPLPHYKLGSTIKIRGNFENQFQLVPISPYATSF